MGYRRATKVKTRNPDWEPDDHRSSTASPLVGVEGKTVRGEIARSSYSLTFILYELLPETRQHEDGILSNRE